MHRKTTRPMCIGLAMLLACAFHCAAAHAQEPDEQGQEQPDKQDEQETPQAELAPVVAHFDFEGDELQPCWFNMAHQGKMLITHEPAHVRAGRGSLEFAYTPAERKLALIGATPIKPQGRVRSLAFSLKTDGPSAVVYGVNEADGSSYQGYCYSPGAQWHDVLVDVNELILSEDSTDENSRLDVSQVNAFIVADLCNLPGEVGQALGTKEGIQHMWLDNVALGKDLAPHRSSLSHAGGHCFIVDDFEADFIACLPIGAPQLTLVEGPHTGEDCQALRVAYRLGGHRWVGFVAAAGYLDVSGATELRLNIKADHEAHLAVVLERRDGTKYGTEVELKPTGDWCEVVLPISQFGLDPNAEDEAGQPPLSQLRVIIPVIDTTKASVGEDGLGSYALSRICFR